MESHHLIIHDIFTIFVRFSIGTMIQNDIFSYVNSRHLNIKFEMEAEVHKVIPSLDVLY